jgi:hypothetical protein
MPFADRPDVQIPWLFYRVPQQAPVGLPTVFVDRFWDDRERWVPDGVGIVPGSMRPYFGPIPLRPPGPVVGTAEQWLSGVSYETWIAGGYTDPVGCWPISPLVVKFKLKQRQEITNHQPPRAVLLQGQTVGAAGLAGLVVDQAQQLLAGLGRPAGVDQAEQLLAGLGRPAGVDQAEAVAGDGAAAAVDQAEAVAGGASAAPVDQAEDVGADGLAGLVVDQAEDVAAGLGQLADVDQAGEVLGLVGPGAAVDQAEDVADRPNRADVDQAEDVGTGLLRARVDQAEDLADRPNRADVDQAEDVAADEFPVQTVDQAEDVAADAGFVTYPGTTTNGSADVVLAFFYGGIAAGQSASGPCVPPGALVLSHHTDPGTGLEIVTLDSAATCSTSGNYTFS